jgi:N-acetyl-alpha-D-glucosaminyl L-malate synthase BshA
VVATELGMALAARGHEVVFVAHDLPVRLDPLAPRVSFQQVLPYDYPLFNFTPYESALTGKLVDVALSHKLDLLHVHYAIPHAAAAYMAQQILRDQGYALPFITTLHGTDITIVGRDEAYRAIVNFSLNHSDGISAVSNYLRDETVRQFDVEKESIAVIHNFIDLNRFRPNPNKRARESVTPCRERLAPHGERILMHASNFRAVKRVEDILAVFAKVQRQIPARLVLLGDGPERMKMEHDVRSLGLQGQVDFLGKQDEVERFLPSADVFLMPSENESFGLAALEAMACGVPVISSRSGGLPELVEDGVSGFLDPVGDVEAMAQHTLQLLEDDDVLCHFSKAARLRAENFDLHSIVPAYESLYENVVALNLRILS